MSVKQIGRLVIALGFAALAAFLAWSFATAPYELVQTCTTRPQPDGTGLFVGALAAGFAALVAAFSGDWG